MKKQFLSTGALQLVLILIGLNACNRSDSFQDFALETQHNNVFTTAEVSIDEAEAELLSFLQASEGNTKVGNSRIIESRFSKGGAMTKGDDNKDTPLVHIFNFSDNQGYAIMAGDRRVSPILCIMDSGHLTPESTIDNPQMLLAFSELDTYYRLKTGMPIIDSEGNTIIVPTEEEKQGIRGGNTKSGDGGYTYVYGVWGPYSTVGQKLSCTWGQRSPFNANCTTTDGRPAFAGCGPIAVAQVMYYHGKCVTYKDTYWDWPVMRYVYNQNSTPTNPNAWDLVKRLIALLGIPENLDVTYGAVADLQGSSSSPGNIPRTFEHFGYASGGSIEDYDYTTLKNNLQNGPAIGIGYCYKTTTVTTFLGIPINTEITYSGGHGWVFDQSMTRRRSVDVYYEGRLVYSYYQTEELIHINWGWNDGIDNGFYYPFRFDVNEGWVTRGSTSTTEGTNLYFQFNLQMNCTIQDD